MLDWSAIGPALKTWAAVGTGVAQVVMANEPRPLTKATWVRLQATGVEPHGFDDTSIVDVLVGSPAVAHPRQRIEGQRTFTLRVSIESLSQSGAGNADNPLERLRATWQLAGLEAVLLAVNVSVADFGPSQMGDIELDQHVISTWFADVQMNAAFTFTDTTDVDTIESIHVTPAFAEPDGSPAPSPLNAPFTAPPP